MNSFKNFMEDYKLLLRAVPGMITMLFCLSVVVMNLMASKVIINTPLVAVTGGIIISWIPFLCMDVVTKHFGHPAANKMVILALVVNLICVGIFELITHIQIDLTAAHTDYSTFNSVYICSWFVLLSSSVAFITSGFANNILNAAIGNLFKRSPDGVAAFTARSYISTFVGQCVDNIVFMGMLYLIFIPGIVSVPAIFGAGVLGSLLELLMEIIFSPIGYKICLRWKAESVGKQYITERENYHGKA